MLKWLYECLKGKNQKRFWLSSNGKKLQICRFYPLRQLLLISNFRTLCVWWRQNSKKSCFGQQLLSWEWRRWASSEFVVNFCDKTWKSRRRRLPIATSHRSSGPHKKSVKKSGLLAELMEVPTLIFPMISGLSEFDRKIFDLIWSKNVVFGNHKSEILMWQ